MHLPLPYSARFALFWTQNPENLLIFSAGNDGDIVDGRPCTIGSPATAKNVLAVGATASGATRLGSTSAEGGHADGSNGYGDIDTVAFFSSYGPTRDNRIKPEILAPGDAVRTPVLLSTQFAICPVKSFVSTT